MNNPKKLISKLFIGALALSSITVFAGECRIQGSYGYDYQGTSYSPQSGAGSIMQTGIFSIDSSGNFKGDGTFTVQFANFANSGSPVWLLLHEVQSSGIVTPDSSNPCRGVVNFSATATVLNSSSPNIVPVGATLYSNTPTSIAYTLNGSDSGNFISTAPMGTSASGSFHKQR